MTLFFRLPRNLLSAIGFALVCAVPVAYAAELEGTTVTVDGAVPVQVQIGTVPAAPAEPDSMSPEQPPKAPASDDQHGEHNNQWQQGSRHQNWEREFETGMKHAFGEQKNNGFDYSQLVPITAIIFIFGGPIFLLCFWLLQRYRAKARRQQDINTNIEKLLAAGRDIPIELLRGDEPKSDEPVGSRDKGIRNIFLGTGWLVFLTIMVGFDIGSAGFIWIALGLSQVLIWYLNRPNGTEQAGQQD
jgi:hypothetical protein